MTDKERIEKLEQEVFGKNIQELSYARLQESVSDLHELLENLSFLTGKERRGGSQRLEVLANLRLRVEDVSDELRRLTMSIL